MSMNINIIQRIILLRGERIGKVLGSVMDLNTLNLDPDPGFWPTLDPDPGPYLGLYYKL